MKLELYKALKAITIPDNLAEATVIAMDAHIENHIGSSTAALLAKMDALGSEMRSGLAAGLSVTNTKVDASASVTNAKLDAYALIKSNADRQKELRTQNHRWLATYAVTVAGLLGGWMHSAGVF